MAMQVDLRAVDLKALDELGVDALALPLYKVRAQPAGVASFVDWRLCGRLAVMIRDGAVTGAKDEIQMLAYPKRTGIDRVFVFGMGSPTKRDAARLTAEATRIVEVLAGAGARQVAYAPPVSPYKIGPTFEDLALAWLENPELKAAPFLRASLLYTGDAPDSKRLKKSAKSCGLSWRNAG